MGYVAFRHTPEFMHTLEFRNELEFTHMVRLRRGLKCMRREFMHGGSRCYQSRVKEDNRLYHIMACNHTPHVRVIRRLFSVMTPYNV